MRNLETAREPGAERKSEEGFLLVGVIVMVALVLLFLSIAAPVVAKDLRRERELEAVHRGQQYTRAIRLFYLKFNTYPASIEALEKTNNIRYLRQRYVDPMTGKQDWRKIGFGQAKTTVKGFFGQPLAGLGGAGSLGSASGLASSQQPGQSAFGGQSGILGAQGGVATPGAGAGSAGTTGAGGSDSSSSGSSSFGSSSFGSSSFGSSSQSGSGSSGTGGTSGPFVGVGIPKEGASIIELNEQKDYSTWEFIYDPRIEQLYSKVSLFGGGPASTSSGSLGSASSLSGSGNGAFGSSSFGNSGAGTTGASGTAGNSGSGSGTGSSGTGSSPTPPQ
jgi:type II secretory pathway pseudopilin PulG